MAQELDLSSLREESYDIFLCTRGLPDALTAETAALRQLMSALVGQGYRVFFPSALPKETAKEDLAAAMAGAVRTSRVMIAAAVGTEGAADATARFLWKRFREMSEGDPERRFLACVREVETLPEELQGAEILDMGGLDFLSELQRRLQEVLPEREERQAEENDPEEEGGPAAKEETAGPEAAEETAPKSPDRRRKLFLALAVAGAVIVLLGLLLLLR